MTSDLQETILKREVQGREGGRASGVIASVSNRGPPQPTEKNPSGAATDEATAGGTDGRNRWGGM